MLVVSTRRLNDEFVRRSETTYSLSQCVQFCVEETDFKCRGFAYRNGDGCGGTARSQCTT